MLINLEKMQTSYPISLETPSIESDCELDPNAIPRSDVS